MCSEDMLIIEKFIQNAVLCHHQQVARDLRVLRAYIGASSIPR